MFHGIEQCGGLLATQLQATAGVQILGKKKRIGHFLDHHLLSQLGSKPGM